MKAVIPAHHARICPVRAWGIDQAWDDPTKACVCGALAQGEGEMLSEKQQRLADAMRNEYCYEGSNVGIAPDLMRASHPDAEKAATRLVQPWEKDEPLDYSNIFYPTSVTAGSDEPIAGPVAKARYEAQMRQFPSGATRNIDQDKLDPQGFIHPLTLLAFCEYMHLHRKQADGQLRDSSNWWKGIPRQAYGASLERHVLLDVKPLLAGFEGHTTHDLVEALCASWFNIQGLLLEVLLERGAE